MKTTSQKRLVLAVGASLLLLVVLFAGQRWRHRQAGAIQDFQVPVLAGWEKKGTENESVRFHKTVQGTKIILSLMCDRASVGSRLPTTVADLQTHAQRDKAMMAGRRSRFNIQVQVLVAEQPIQFHNMPAIFGQETASSKRGVTQNKHLRFTNGKNLYLLDQSVSSEPGTSPSPEAQAEADQAWKTLTEGLKPA